MRPIVQSYQFYRLYSKIKHFWPDLRHCEGVKSQCTIQRNFMDFAVWLLPECGLVFGVQKRDAHETHWIETCEWNKTLLQVCLHNIKKLILRDVGSLTNMPGGSRRGLSAHRNDLKSSRNPLGWAARLSACGPEHKGHDRLHLGELQPNPSCDLHERGIRNLRGETYLRKRRGCSHRAEHPTTMYSRVLLPH